MIDYDTIARNPDLLQVGLRCRHPKAGPELDMVMEYVAERLPPAGPGERREVLLEPHVCTSYPDAVVLYWDEAAGTRLRTRFDEIRLIDLQVLSALSHRRSWSLQCVRAAYGRQTERSLERLENAGAVVVAGSRVRAAPVDDILALRRLIAIEAKMRDWRSGLAQALHNTWFAPESYLLLPTLPQRRTPQNEAERLSVGLLDQRTPILKPSPQAHRRLRRHPAVGAWLVNTWAAALT
jgi:hypothetical protein